MLPISQPQRYKSNIYFQDTTLLHNVLLTCPNLYVCGRLAIGREKQNFCDKTSHLGEYFKYMNSINNINLSTVANLNRRDFLFYAILWPVAWPASRFAAVFYCRYENNQGI